jgi:hypothetical protein
MFTTHIVFLRSVRRLLVTANAVPVSPFRVTLMTEALSSSTTSVLRRATRRNIPGDGILHVYNPYILKNHLHNSVFGLVFQKERPQNVFER